MNAEFKRNLWLEISPSRIVLMTGVLALIFGIAWLSAGVDDKANAVAGTGQFLFGVIVGLWGSYKAGRSVSDEIKERTWDFQRLSALSPMAMTFGKLFGATAYVWYGGLICAAAYGLGTAHAESLTQTAFQTAGLVVTGVFAHAVALFVSLGAVRRGRGDGRVDSFVYTLAGIAAFQTGGAISGRTFDMLRRAVDPEGPISETTVWWGATFPAQALAFAFVCVLAVWAIVTAWRLMRVELQAPANPLWFPLFLLAPALLLGGAGDEFFQRAATTYFVTHGLVLFTLLAEPKDIVAWRALAARQKSRDAGRFWPASLTGLIVAFVAACGVAAAYAMSQERGDEVSPLIGFAAFAFLLRETAIFAFFHLGARQRRGDFGALVTIALLCFAGPAILNVANLGEGVGLFIVDMRGNQISHLLSIASGLVQAAIFGVMAQARWKGREKAIEAAA
ncbi:MAG: hypothetical protein JNM47_09170 [Hyphomonadaceae bacterium]|nr:hypothetical protein [Hyphomonadaceae bacterium]